jgi:hypothetical protein
MTSATRVLRLALVDSGVNRGVANFAKLVGQAYRRNPEGGFDCCDEPDNDRCGHGTGMAGILAAMSSGSLEIVDVGILDENNSCSLAALEAGIDFAASFDPEIMLLALATLVEHAPGVERAVSLALKRGIIVVAARGRGVPQASAIPARLDGVVGVEAGNVRRLQDWTYDSSAAVKIGAYGGVVKTLSRTGRTVEIWGNSSAAALMAAICCSHLRTHPGTTSEKMMEYLRENATSGQ